MNPIVEFIKYEKAGSDEKYLGIATVKYLGKIILNYKVVMKKDGSGYFPTVGSYKNPQDSTQFLGWFLIESNFEIQEIENCIRKNIRQYMHPEPQQHYQTNMQPIQQSNGQHIYQPQQQQQYARAQPAPLPAQQSIFGDENVPF